jgi:hypothetical protein
MMPPAGGCAAGMTMEQGRRFMVERGKATRGKVAKAAAGAEQIEIKATVPNHQIVPALRRFGLTAHNDEERFIYFFDTPKLDLLGAGIITRARRVIGDDHDSTVKFRPVVPADVGKEWRKYRGFKIEADASENGMVKSASFSMPVDKGVIKRVAAGKRSIAALFTDEQEAFLATMAGHEVDFSTLVALGPLQAQRWELEHPACPWPMTVELWRRGDGKRLLEVSIKTPVVQAAAAIGGFMAFLAEVGAERDREQQTKTRWALEFYAAKYARPAGAAKKAAGAPKKAAKRAPAKSVARKPPSKRAKSAVAKGASKNAKTAVAKAPRRRPPVATRRRGV